MDKRIQNLSYSSLLTLHTCPRKFQLYRLNAEVEATEDVPGSVTFAYGHAVGSGVQHILSGLSMDQAMWLMFLEWDIDLLAENPKQNKSFFGAIVAIQQFASMFENGYLEGYELVHYQGKPATELSFVIHLPDGFKYRGFVDAVLQHKTTGEVLVLECKTTNAATVNPAQYKNSAQAIGYSIVLDALFPTLSAYKVLYLVYQTKSESYVQLPFDKSYYSRALWIRELLLEIEVIKLYESAEIYPMHGESCYSFFRECEYMQTCTLSTERLTSPLSPGDEAKLDAQLEQFQIQIGIEDLISAQLAKDARPHQPALIQAGDSDDEFI
jgi:PD-(D/E)XK nuclease superfamily